MNKKTVSLTMISLAIAASLIAFLTAFTGSERNVGKEIETIKTEKNDRKDGKDDSEEESEPLVSSTNKEIKDEKEEIGEESTEMASLEKDISAGPTEERAKEPVNSELSSFIPIKQRDSGKRVKEVQTLLNKFGYSIVEDGSFGPQTVDVVKDFQKQTKLAQSGIVNEETYNKLLSLESTNLASEYLAALAEKKRIEEQKKKEQEAIDKASEIFIPVKTVMQKPALPNGCEITSLTSILNFHGYNVSHTHMADHYLPKKPFTYQDGKRFGPNPFEYYVGDPRQQPGGWYSYAPPVVTAGNQYLSEQGSTKKVVDIRGSSKEQILNHLKNDTPVVMWVTLDLSKPKVNSHWYLQETGEYYAATTNLHVVVLNGVIGNKVHVMNPLVGQVTYNLDAFFNSYQQMGNHAVIVQ